MGAVSISKDAVICVRQWLRSYQRDISRDIVELNDIIRDGCSSDSDEHEFQTLWQIKKILSSLDSALSNIEKGVCEK